MIAVLHNIRSLHNVGSIFRTSDAVGIAKLYLCGITPAPIDQYGRKQLALTKVSLGAQDSIVWERASFTLDILERLKQEGFALCALEQSAFSVPIQSYSLPGDRLDRFALVIGNEVDGLSADVLEKCDAAVHIPMYGMKESLNVSVAFGIAVYSLLERTNK